MKAYQYNLTMALGCFSLWVGVDVLGLPMWGVAAAWLAAAVVDVAIDAAKEAAG